MTSYTYMLLGALFVVALLLVIYRPASVTEPFATAAVDPVRVPACTARSEDAQKLLARIAEFPQENDEAAELRMLVSKLCCMEADISAPSAGMMRTLNFQFRTSQDTEPASSFVSRCIKNAVQQRDIDIVVEKMQERGHKLLSVLLGGACAEEHALFDKVVMRTRTSMMTFCLMKQPTMDHPIGARDMGFWEPDSVADLSQYNGISATPK
jgi:hypothetical protein